jgi:nitroreductase
MEYTQPATQLIRRRFSCRSYAAGPIGSAERRRLADAAAAMKAGPLGGPLRFQLIAATAEDSQELKRLGTYGFIHGAAGFLAGAAPRSAMQLEDFGYRMEQLVLLATDLGLGSCWLGGTFTQGSFAAKISLNKAEDLPAVVAIGRIAGEQPDPRGVIRRLAGSANRLPWTDIFFDGAAGEPLTPDSAGPFAEVLEMVRRAPSASNKQPWRIVRAKKSWDFHLQRTPGYREGFFQRILRLVDLQRVDMGIAMCHFELAAGELGRRGEWTARSDANRLREGMEYIVSWAEKE